MDKNQDMPRQNRLLQPEEKKAKVKAEETISVVHEQATIHKEIVETGKVHIRKRVTEEVVSVNLPIINESYRVEHVPVEKKILDTLPPAVRYEGDKMIIPVLREITVVQKKYEVIEELHIIKQSVETPLVQEITLLKEHINVERSNPKQV
jgi:uncharacterized protein (TIGR02271 family)